MLKVYVYDGCGTCRNALKWLRAAGVPHETVPIRETPPSMQELRAVLKANGGRIAALFNTSGQDYRTLGLKDKLAGLTNEDALKLLAGNGNLVKRPFAIDAGKQTCLCGFREDVWKAALL
jgi:arsenate reductase